MKISIRCKRKEGLWRAGVFHPGEAVVHEAAKFTPAQRKLLEEEPLLLVEAVEEAEAGPLSGLNAKDSIARIAELADKAALQAIAETDERKTVREAAIARLGALAAE